LIIRNQRHTFIELWCVSFTGFVRAQQINGSVRCNEYCLVGNRHHVRHDYSFANRQGVSRGRRVRINTRVTVSRGDDDIREYVVRVGRRRTRLLLKSSSENNGKCAKTKLAKEKIPTARRVGTSVLAGNVIVVRGNAVRFAQTSVSSCTRFQQRQCVMSVQLGYVNICACTLLRWSGRTDPGKTNPTKHTSKRTIIRSI